MARKAPLSPPCDGSLVAPVVPPLYAREDDQDVKCITFSSGRRGRTRLSVVGGLGGAEASLGGLTNPGVPVVNADYVRRYRTYYARKDYRSRCEGGGWAEIRELQRFWPQTLWPPSMRCFPYR